MSDQDETPVPSGTEIFFALLSLLVLVLAMLPAISYLVWGVDGVVSVLFIYLILYGIGDWFHDISKWMLETAETEKGSHGELTS